MRDFFVFVGGPTSARCFGFAGRLPPAFAARARLPQKRGGASFCFCGRADHGAMLLTLAGRLAPVFAAWARHPQRRCGVGFAFVGGPTSARSFWLCWQAPACVRRGGAPPTEAGRCELLLLWEGRPRRDASALLADWRLGSPRGRASHKGGAVWAFDFVGGPASARCF